MNPFGQSFGQLPTTQPSPFGVPSTMQSFESQQPAMMNLSQIQTQIGELKQMLLQVMKNQESIMIQLKKSLFVNDMSVSDYTIRKAIHDIDPNIRQDRSGYEEAYRQYNK